jgi:hypothetical protein
VSSWVLLGVVALGCYDPTFAEPAGSDGVLPQGGGPWRDSASCPSTYQLTETGCYRVELGEATWQAAEADCEDDDPGATHLVVFETTEEHDVVWSLGPAEWDLWIGLVNDGGGWQWVTGGAPTFSRWEGDGMDGWTCGRIVNGEWDDEECPKLQDYACEHDGRPPRVGPAP